MKILNAFRYLLNPTEEQLVLLYKMAGCGRVAFNDSLDFILNLLAKETGISDRKELYKYLNAIAPKERFVLIKKLPKTAALNKHLTQWKKKEDRLWLTDAFAVCLQQRQRDLREASLEALAEGKRGFPVWRTRRKAHHSTMRFVQFPKYCQILDRHIKRPNGLKLVRFRKSQDIQGTPKQEHDMLNQQTIEKLWSLKLTGMVEALEQQLEQPQSHDLSFEERLSILVDRESLYRENRRLARLLKAV